MNLHPMKMLSTTLARLQNLVHSLEQRQLGALGCVFPRCEHPGDRVGFPGKDIWNMNYPDRLQPFSANHRLTDNYCIFRDCCSFGQLAPILLASIIKPHPKLDFKAYTINFSSKSWDESVLSFPGSSNTKTIEDAIKQWVQLCDIPNRRKDLIFRRCIVVDYITYFIKEKLERSGHAITLAIEIEGKKLTLKII